MMFGIDNYFYPFPDNPPPEIYKNRRNEFRKLLNDDVVYLAFSSGFYSNEKHNKFRQNSDILYLTGYPYFEAVLLLSKNGIDYEGELKYEILLVQKQDNMDKKWNGSRPNKKQIQEFSGIMDIFWLDEVDYKDFFKDAIEINVAPYTKGGHFTPYQGSVNVPIELKIDFFKIIKNHYPFIVYNMDMRNSKVLREIKDKYEINLLKKAVDISVEAHKKVIKNIKSIKNEYEIEGIIEGEFKRLGAENTAYNSIVGTEINSCVLHYSSNRAKVKSNELILFDCGAEYHGYASDITRTVPSNGKFSKEQAIIYNIVLKAQDRAINYCKEGIKFSEVDSVARFVIDSALIDLGLINDRSLSRLYFPHGTSHYLGLDVHDVGTYDRLMVGNCITVEPGIYIPKDSNCDKKWWNIGVRIEDDILITKDGNEVLSKNLVKDIKSLEELMNK